jgi:hypothetical protein
MKVMAMAIMKEGAGEVPDGGADVVDQVGVAKPLAPGHGIVQ